ncbi:MAG: Zinc ribbon domain protein [Lentisphaerae bacterium ADurb.BinA184]|nr:MAG: Zinc ribbon domain protein [Lentisphaerae bacterium ADurb.BinA184]
MPIYEYKCAACGHRFERLVRRPADVPKACPECGHDQPAKAFSTFSARVSAGKSVCADAGDCPSGGCCAGKKSCPF